MMIARIILGAGSNRQVFDLPRDKEERRTVGAALKRSLFPTGASFGRAKKRGALALAGGR